MINNKTKEIINISLTAVFFLALILLIITFSIGLPIYFRPFYYFQINLRNLPAETGFSYQVIKEAYDEVLNYLCFGTDFGTGQLLHSESGKDHFVDCKVLFDLNITVFLITLPIIIALYILNKKEIISLKRVFGFKVSFYSAIFTVLIPLIIGTLAISNFDKAFTIFHKVFFPGKDNWYFNPTTDEIIQVLPQGFFASCAALIGSSLLIIATTLIITGIIERKKHLKNA